MQGGIGSAPAAKRKQHRTERGRTCDPNRPSTERCPPTSVELVHGLAPHGQGQGLAGDTPLSGAPERPVCDPGASQSFGSGAGTGAELAKPTLRERQGPTPEVAGTTG